MPALVVQESGPLRGTVSVRGAKNAALKAMVATLLAPGRHRLSNVPDILDVALMVDVLSHMGAHVRRDNGDVEVVVPDELTPEAPFELVRAMRASIIVLGPLLAATGRAAVALPGGDDLGARPIDFHLSGLRAMGAEIELAHGVLHGHTSGRLKGTDIELPFPSVGATENLLLAGALAEGETVIVNAAREPEVVDLAELLNAMGAGISGAGSPIVRVTGVEALHPVSHRVLPDRIEAGTYAIAGAITGGDVTVTGCVPEHLRMELITLEAAGCSIERGEGWLRLKGPERARATDFSTLPYPGFATDLHPQTVALLATADGTSIITENLFDARFRYAGELARMGADITTEWQHAVIRGVPSLSGCPVVAPDIRAGAALVLAGLRADGETLVTDIGHIDRGYQDFAGTLRGLGAKIERVEDPY